MKILKPVLFLLFVWIWVQGKGQIDQKNLLTMSRGQIEFVSEAPLELISAKTTNFQAVIDTVNGKFAFSVPMSSFLGFNSPLQREHFNENYVESNKYQNATYTGKIIEAWQQPTTVKRKVRTKGKLTIHGESSEQLIEASIEKVGDLMRVQSTFKVKAEDYSIKIPRLVNQKIAEEIDVSVDVYFKLK